MDSNIRAIAVVNTIIAVEGKKFGLTVYEPGEMDYSEDTAIENFNMGRAGYNLIFCAGEKGRNYREVWVKFK